MSRATLYRWEAEGRIGKLDRLRLGPGRVALAARDVAAAARSIMGQKKRKVDNGQQRERG